mmetsp:Transcript_45210/g.94842  ORF Transcript_45210/g.94842 Transcript_45210/m.94842 type:complete len:267 (-) Transcript_45210:147-947(-)
MKIISSRPPLLPPRTTSANLFLIGSTIGPIVDSLHNQCLLAYDIAPISLPNPVASSAPPLFCSSWAVPPLLGIAYVILGYILPRVIEILSNTQIYSNDGGSTNDSQTQNRELKNKAILAVTSTAAIIKLSDFLQTHDSIGPLMLDAKTNLGIMVAADAIQWIALDRTPVALLAASITAIGGPLSELPFVANGFWHYLPESADYLPLSGDFFQSGGIADAVATKILGAEYNDLALSSITGPCYFAVTTDAIALSRYFYQIGCGEEET